MGRWVLLGEMVVVMVVLIATAAAGPTVEIVNGQISEQNQPKKFSSYEELKNFVGANAGYSGTGHESPLPAQSEYSIINDGEAPVDYSTTNIQVGGVDEADIVKSDGKFIHVVSGNSVIIMDAYPAENARVLSEIEVGGYSTELFINGNKLVVLEDRYLKVYDVSDRENPVLRREVSFDGHYFNSRMIGNYVYLIIISPPIYAWTEEINLPDISCNGYVKTVPATEIYYFENLYDYSYEFTTVMAINAQNDDEEITSKTFLMGAAQNIFVSSSNIYTTYCFEGAWSGEMGCVATEITIIHKIAITGGEIEYRSQGEVPGHVLNQFSMDEYQGYFRIATTTGEIWDGSAQNHVYVLDEDLNITGGLENLAPGERIYSARFIGSRVYLVTFVKVDPLFVIDLADPANPRVLGELKIPGYSDYLHPYDETHLIGVGKDTIDSEWGNFAWYQGVKIALFDVSDPENPIEISKCIVGQRGTESLALRDHKAFLFNRSKNLLIMPIGSYYGEDAYVFHISVENGIVLKGTITHQEDNGVGDNYYSNYWYSCNRSVKRSLYIDDVIYTISDELIKMNDLESLDEIGKVFLSPPYVVEITGRQVDLGSSDSGDLQNITIELGSTISLLAALMVASGLLRYWYRKASSPK